MWGGFLYAYTQGLINIDLEPPGEEVAQGPLEAAPEAEDDATKARKKGVKRKRKPRPGDSLVGDDLGGPDSRNLDMEGGGGEAQLLGHEIEQGFDGAMPRIRRCLILAAGDEPVTGKLTFGLRIAGSGKVTKVNLRGPNMVTQSEAGECLRSAASGIKFRSFDGPDMLVSFPLTLN